MIKKILNIQNIGRFKSFSNRSDELTFDKNTFIFGKNTLGKSTLTAIFRSILTENPDYIIGRKSFGSTEDQKVNIQLDTEILSFSGGSWNERMLIKVFDSKYINENIFSDDHINDKQRKLLTNLILGEKGKLLETDYLEAKKLKDENTNEKTKITTTYNKLIGKGAFTFDEFKKLNEDKDIDNKIIGVKTQLTAFSNQTLIKTKIEQLSIKLALFKEVDIDQLSETVESKQELVKTHIQDNLKIKSGSLKFIETGVGLLKETTESRKRNCTFCGQQLGEDAEKLINEYQILFSKEYKQLQKMVKDTHSKLSNSNLESVLSSTQLELLELGINISLTELWGLIDSEVQTFQSEIDKKIKDLDYIIDFTSLRNCIDTINKFKLDKIDDLYEQYKDNVDIVTVTNLKKSQIKLETTKKRFEPEWVEYCSQYNKLELKFLKTLKPKEEALFLERKKYAEEVMTDYQKNINIILTKLNAGFSLVDFSVPQNRREVLKLFTIQFENSTFKIPLDGSEAEPSFKNTLSDSDKRLLAFAFFVAELQNMKNLDEYVIVLDDPMSSFDIERKLSTIKVLRDELKDKNDNKVKQLIILTHEENFFKFLDKLFNTSKKFLRIGINSTTKNSQLEECDIYESFIKDTHFKQLDMLQKYKEGEMSTCNLDSVRIIMEHIIKRKYFLDIPSTVVSNGGVISWYKENISDDTLTQKIDDIFPHSPHHDQSGFQVGTEEMSDGDQKSLVSDFLEVIKQI